jgi:hypothetical protein
MGFTSMTCGPILGSMSIADGPGCTRPKQERLGLSAQTKPPSLTLGWSISEAEELIRTLNGVLSARIMTGRGGVVEEIHVLTSEELSPKQTVRNVESALLAHFDLAVDHRKISVAQTSRGIPGSQVQEGSVSLLLDSAGVLPDSRILYHSHSTETESSNRARVKVSLEWGGETYEGTAVSADLPRPRLEAASNATLRAVEAVAAATARDPARPPVVALALDGVKVVDAFDRRFALVAVHALAGRDIIALSGAAVVTDRTDGSVILATLQATDRWVRGRIA